MFMVSVSNLFWSNGTMFFDDLAKPLGNLGYVSLLCLWFPGFYSNRLNCNFFCMYVSTNIGLHAEDNT